MSLWYADILLTLLLLLLSTEYLYSKYVLLGKVMKFLYPKRQHGYRRIMMLGQMRHNHNLEGKIKKKIAPFDLEDLNLEDLQQQFGQAIHERGILEIGGDSKGDGNDAIAAAGGGFGLGHGGGAVFPERPFGAPFGAAYALAGSEGGEYKERDPTPPKAPSPREAAAARKGGGSWGSGSGSGGLSYGNWIKYLFGYGDQQPSGSSSSKSSSVPSSLPGFIASVPE
jgi:hypothetical protein